MRDIKIISLLTAIFLLSGFTPEEIRNIEKSSNNVTETSTPAHQHCFFLIRIYDFIYLNHDTKKCPYFIFSSNYS